MKQFSQSSTDKLSTCEKDLQLVMRESIKVSLVDFGIGEGHRPDERQLSLFKQGRELVSDVWRIVDKSKVVTNIDGIKVKGKHNYLPSKAVDITIYVPGHPEWTYDNEHLCYVAGVIMATAERLYNDGLITHKIRWGGNWDSDGIILKDQNLADRPHFEIID